MPKQSVIQQENIELKSQLQEANIRLARAEAKASYFETEYERVIQALKQAQREKFAATSERPTSRNPPQNQVFAIVKSKSPKM